MRVTLQRIQFFVAGVPKSMKIAGVARFQRAGKVHMVPKRANSDWALLVGEVGRRHAPDAPLEGPLAFTASFYLPRPQSASARSTAPIKRPDLDNLIHKLTDNWNGCFYRDDSQITELHVWKRFAENGKTGVAITVEARPCPPTPGGSSTV